MSNKTPQVEVHHDKKYWWVHYFIILFLLSGCSISKHLSEDEFLYNSTSINFVEGSKVVNEGVLKYSLDDLSQPKPNTKLWLWTFYKFGNPEKKGGLGNFIKKRFGQPPVFYDEDAITRNSLVLRKHMIDQGYFDASVAYDTSQSGQKVDVAYNIATSGRHRIRNISLPKDSSNITEVIKAIEDHTYLRTGEYYSLAKLVNERSRIAIEARNRGYFDFSEDRVFYFVDTNAVRTDTELASDIWLEIKKPQNRSDYKKYYIGNTFVYPNYDLTRASSILIRDSIKYRDLTIFQNNQILKPRTLDEAITQSFGEVFSEERSIATSNHLLDLGVYKFVNIKYRILERNDTNYLDRLIYLTPGKVQDVGAEIEATTRPGAYGLSLKGKYSHKNMFGGAERLDLSLATGLEQGGNIVISDDTLSNNLREITARADLSFPRFIVPFVKIANSSSFHTPRTRIGILANFQNRPELFSLSNYKVTFGYDWDETRRKRHQVDLLAFNILQISKRSDSFIRLLEQNSLLQRSFSNLFILGSTYTYTLTNQELNRPSNYFFFLGQLEASGNSSYLLSRLFSPDGSQPYKFFRREFSQFSKVDFDFRYNWIGKGGNLVTKLSGGVGFAYLNSVSLPFVKQYYAGGANSMRGFPIRGLLGTFRNSDSEVAQSSFDQSGDLKLEWNIELRFNLLRALYLKGAFFTDIGNVWKLDLHGLETDSRKVFSPRDFLSELAVASGFGVRLDIQYFVLRLDLGLPLRKPFLSAGDRWTFSKITDSGWLKNNMVYNIALGYPF
ncbi:MAG: BamA/TamA family outer membrane protein [Saprospiraceae bacterium]|nr:BamA/TamA family outer membrane protein [Saprospiraceae bacterium]